MNKLDMAHDYLKVLLTQNTSRTVGEAVETAYALADAMQAEANKRNKPEIHLVSIDTEVNGNKMTLEFIHTDMKAAAKAIQDLLEDKQ